MRTQEEVCHVFPPRPSSVFTVFVSDSPTYPALTSLSNQVGPPALTPIALGLSIHFLHSDKKRVKKKGGGGVKNKDISGKYPQYRQILFPSLKI